MWQIIIEQHVFMYPNPKTNKKSWGDAPDEGTRGKITCTPKSKCWHIGDYRYVVNIVQNVQNSPNDRKPCSVASMTTWPWAEILQACSGSACECTPDRWHAIPQAGPLLGFVPFEVGSDYVKVVAGACPANVLLDSGPVIELARPWNRFLPDRGTVWRLWLCVLRYFMLYHVPNV